MAALSEDDLDLLHRTVELAITAVRAGDRPCGALLVDGHGGILLEDNTRHPGLRLARWAVVHLSPGQRRSAVVYTATEYCPRCAAAHARAGLGRVVYASSATQLSAWYRSWGAPTRAVATHPVAGDGPAPVFTEVLRDLHHWHYLSLVDAPADAAQTPPGKPS